MPKILSTLHICHHWATPTLYLLAHYKEKGFKQCQNDQSFFQDFYINDDLRELYNIKLDYNSTIFFNIYGAAEEAEFQCLDGSIKYVN